MVGWLTGLGWGQLPLRNGQSVVRKSPYGILVVEQRAGLRTLRFAPSLTVQSAYDIRHPENLVAAYTRLAMAALPCSWQPQRILFIGVGGGSMVGYVHRVLPRCHIQAVDLDPEVLQVAQDYFGVVPDERLELIAEDGRRFLELSQESYDVIFLDAYGERDIPLSLATREFLELVRSRLSDDGVVVSNLWGRLYNPLYGDMVATYRDVFSEVVSIRAVPEESRIVLAFPRQRRLEAEGLAAMVGRLPGLPELSQTVREGWESLPEGKVLRDP